jgi:hypothetical protein
MEFIILNYVNLVKNKDDFINFNITIYLFIKIKNYNIYK